MTSEARGPTASRPIPDRGRREGRRRQVTVTVAMFLLGVLLASAATAQRSVMIFDFDSGGASHPEGFGAWRVHVDGHRADFVHTVRDEVTAYPAATLSDDERARLWRRVEALEAAHRGNSTTSTAPGQPVMTVTVTRGANTTRLSLSGSTLDAHTGIADLMRFLTDLIERHTGQRPVMG